MGVQQEYNNKSVYYKWYLQQLLSNRMLQNLK